MKGEILNNFFTVNLINFIAYLFEVLDYLIILWYTFNITYISTSQAKLNP